MVLEIIDVWWRGRKLKRVSDRSYDRIEKQVAEHVAA